MPDTVSHMNFFKRYLFKKALLEDELANEDRKRKEEVQPVIEKQPEAIVENITTVPQIQIAQVVQPRKNEIGGMQFSHSLLN